MTTGNSPASTSGWRTDAGAIDIVSNVVCRRFAVRDVGFEEMRVDLANRPRLRVYAAPTERTWRITHTQT